jgi:hypothetical protein
MTIVINELETEVLDPEQLDAAPTAAQGDVDPASADLPQELARAVALLLERKARLIDD